MKKILTLSCLAFGLSVQAQLVWNPFGFFPYEREDLAKNRVLKIYEYTVESADDEYYGVGYLPDDSLYTKRFDIHSSGWIIEILENEISYDERESLGSYNYVYSGPGGKVSHIDYSSYESDGYTVVFTYNSQGVLQTKNVITPDPTEERFEVKKGLVTSSKNFTSYPLYDDEGDYVKSQAVQSGRTEYSYDKKGLLMETKRYYFNMSEVSEEQLNSIVRYSYTSEGRLSQSEVYDVYGGQENINKRSTYTYDSNNLLTQVFQERFDPNESIYLRYVYTFSK